MVFVARVYRFAEVRLQRRRNQSSLASAASNQTADINQSIKSIAIANPISIKQLILILGKRLNKA